MKKNKLYTVNKYNKNLFYDGGLAVPVSLPSSIHGIDTPYSVSPGVSSLASLAGGIDLPTSLSYSGPQVTLSGTQKFNATTNNLFPEGSASLGALGAASTLVNQLGNKFISDGYNAGGVGNGIATAGQMVGNIVGQINPVAGVIVNAASGIVGGLTNRTFGTKKNEKNISAIQNNTSALRDAGSQLASASTNDAVLNAAGNMGTTSNFATTDLVKGGWAKSAKRKARKQGQRYINAEDAAFAVQNHGLLTGAENADANQDSTAMSNYIYAMGGKKTKGQRRAKKFLDWMTTPGLKYIIEEAKKPSSQREAPEWINYNLQDIWNAVTGKSDNSKKRIEPTPGEFGGGEFGGGGYGTKFGEEWLPTNEVKRDTIWLPIEETFNDAFGRARRAGLPKFTFDEKEYTTELGDNPDNYEAGQKRTQVVGAIPIPVEYNKKGAKRASDMTDEEFNAAMAERNAELKAFGGSMDVLDYGLAMDYLTMKNKQIDSKNKMAGISPESPLMNTFGEGGIEIKHPGRLTRLKERTGKTEAELWAEGRPDVRKMITFARNSRKWSKALGGQIHRDGVTVPDNVFCGGGKMFALGGDIQMNGADFTNGATHIDAGGSHESNPNEGIQVGVDPQGTPNLVEEGEVIFNDYVYSNRISCDEETKRKFRISKKRDITYADLAKSLEKESLERPNDPISKAALQNQMADLADQQERQKQEMEAQKAREAFGALSPEEQVAVMQQMSAQEQAAQEQAAQEQAMQEQATAQQQQIAPEEAAMMQEQMADGSQAMIGESPQINAYGGNLYPNGGKLMEALGFHTKGDFEKWLKENGIKETDIPSDLKSNAAWLKAIATKSPVLADVISRGYDFGDYVPNASGNLSFDDDRGNWDAQTVQGWWDSEDPAWKQVIAAHPELTKETKLTKEQLADYLRNTEAFKKGTKWLEDSEDNRLAYLQRIINNPNAPKKAKEYAMRYADANGWKEGAARDYKTIFDNPSGRAANPGTYWKTPLEVARERQIKNLVQNSDGVWEEVVGEIPKDWMQRTYNWSDPTNDYIYNYYKKPPVVEESTLADSAGNPAMTVPEEIAAAKEWRNQGTSGNSEDENEPRHRAEWLRYAGLLGPAVGLGMQALGIGKPDTKAFDAVLEAYDNNPGGWADYKTIGDYLTYRPMDVWAEQNRLNANARATGRAIQNNAAPIGTQMAGLLANDYNNQIASGELYRKGLEYNDALREKTATFNRGTNQFNAEAFNRAALTNAEIANRNRQVRAQLGMQAAAQKADMNAGWYKGIYGNIAGLFNGISEIGRENGLWNMASRGAADGVYGVMSDRTHTSEPYIKKEKESKGGKIKRKKGLTF